MLEMKKKIYQLYINNRPTIVRTLVYTVGHFCIAECISTDQVPAEHIEEYFKDKKFKKFYYEEYINPYARNEEEDLPTLH